MRIEIPEPIGRLRLQIAAKIPAHPKAYARSGKSRGRSFKNESDIAYQNTVYTHFWDYVKEHNLVPYMPWNEGPVMAICYFFFQTDIFPYPPMVKQPDVDNLTKNVLDSISLQKGKATVHRGLLWDDDIVTDGHIYKRYGPEDLVVVQLYFYERYLTEKELTKIEAQNQYEALLRTLLLEDEPKGRIPAQWTDSPQTASETQTGTKTGASIRRDFRDKRLQGLQPS